MSLDNLLMQRPSKSLNHAQQCLWHQLHEDRGFVLDCHTAEVLDDVLMLETPKQLTLMLKLLQKDLVLGSHDFDSHLWR